MNDETKQHDQWSLEGNFSELLVKTEILSRIMLDTKFDKEIKTLRTAILQVVDEEQLEVATAKVNAYVKITLADFSKEDKAEYWRKMFEKKQIIGGLLKEIALTEELFDTKLLIALHQANVPLTNEEILLFLKGQVKDFIAVINSLHIEPTDSDVMYHAMSVVITNYDAFKEELAFHEFLEIGENILNDLDPIREAFKNMNVKEQAKIAKTNIAFVETCELEPEAFKAMVFEMPAVHFVNNNTYTVNPLAKNLPSADKIEYFSTKIELGNDLPYAFMDKDLGIMSLVGTENEILTLEEIAAVMKNYEDKKHDNDVLDMIASYKLQLKPLEEKA